MPNFCHISAVSLQSAIALYLCFVSKYSIIFEYMRNLVSKPIFFPQLEDSFKYIVHEESLV